MKPAGSVGVASLDDLAELLREQNRLLRKIAAGQRANTRALLSSAAAAKALGRRHSDVRAWIAEGRLRTVDVDGRERVPRSEIERLQREGLPVKPVRQKVAAGGSLRSFKP